ncbi:MAG: hypothetical protein ACYDBB_11575 [Armatimonadota bacterium]
MDAGGTWNHPAATNGVHKLRRWTQAATEHWFEHWPVYLVEGLIFAAVVVGGGWLVNALSASYSRSELGELGWVLFSSVVTLLVVVIATAVFLPGIVHTAIEQLHGHPVSVADLLGTRRYILPTISLELLLIALTLPIAAAVLIITILIASVFFSTGTQTVSTIVIFSVIIGILAVLILYARTFLAIPSMLEERTGAFGAFTRSWVLTRGHFLHFYMLMVFTWGFWQLLPFLLPFRTPAIITFLSMLFYTVIYPWLAIVSATAYEELAPHAPLLLAELKESDEDDNE